MEHEYHIQKDAYDLKLYRTLLAHNLICIALQLSRQKNALDEKQRKNLIDDLHTARILYDDICMAIFALENHHPDSHLIYEESEMESKKEQEDRQRHFDEWFQNQSDGLPKNYANLIGSAFGQLRSINKNLEKLYLKNWK